MESSPQRDETSEASIVALGAFNPQIFQPQWFAASQLIRKEEADGATIGVVHPEMTIFSTEWFKVEITNARFAISTQDPTKHLPLRELAIGTFRILEHTPVTAVGFNSNRHFAMESSDKWHQLGHHYAPKSSWSPILKNPGMRVLIMEGTREGSKSNRITIKIEPSAKIKDHGVQISINEHFDLDADASPPDRLKSFLVIIESNWDEFLKYADDACEHLLSEAKIEEK